jgi:hypothetical protein
VKPLVVIVVGPSCAAQAGDPPPIDYRGADEKNLVGSIRLYCLCRYQRISDALMISQ